MYLDKILIFNFKSSKRIELNLVQNDPIIFIGLNDSGKSTFLQAVNLLLGDKPKYNSFGEGTYRSDLSNSVIDINQINEVLAENELPSFTYNDDSTLILGKLVFEDKEAETYPELNLTTPLKWSIESNKDNTIWVAQQYSTKGSRTYLLANEAAEGLELWNANQKTISKFLEEKNVSNEDIHNENGKGRFSNFEKIRAIYEKSDCSLKWIEYKFGKGDKDIFPSFSLFDWNTTLDEIIATANAIMQEEIDEHLIPLKTMAAESAVEAEKAINKKFGDISSIIREVAKDVEKISSKVYFDVKEKISDIMVTKTLSDGAIHLENQGEGLKRQIWFSLIKAKADTANDSINKFIWAFDEPETHLYPRAQREFFDALIKIAQGNVQTIISTHSTIFTDKSNLDRINSVKQENDGYSTVNSCKDVEAIYSTLNVKNSDFLFHDKFLIVEGDTEQYLIPKLYEIYRENSLIKENIQLINIQGKDKWIMNKGILDKVMEGFKKSDEQTVYLFDNDMSFVIGNAAIKENMFFVGDQDIEDSIDAEIWLSILNDFYNDIFEFTLEEIKACKGEVVKNTKCQDFEKFYPILKRRIKSKCEESDVEYDTLKRLPSKGIDSAELLLKYIDSQDKIPQRIKDAFDKLNK